MKNFLSALSILFILLVPLQRRNQTHSYWQALESGVQAGFRGLSAVSDQMLGQVEVEGSD